MLKTIMTFILQYYYRFFYFGEERGPCQAPNQSQNRKGYEVAPRFGKKNTFQMT